MGSSSLLPRQVQLALVPQLGFTELASTVLISSSWVAHAAALHTGQWRQPVDPMTKNRCLHAAVVMMITADTVMAILAVVSPTPALIAVISAVLFCAQLACVLLFVRACAALLRSRITPATVRRMSRHLVASAACMCIGLLATISFAMGWPVTPTRRLVVAAMFTYGRIGTAFFQIAVFVPGLHQCRDRVLPHNAEVSAIGCPPARGTLNQPALLRAEISELRKNLAAAVLCAENTELRAKNVKLASTNTRLQAEEQVSNPEGNKR